MGTVLVIDDDRDIRALTHCILQDEGWRVLEATNGVDGLERLRAASEPLVVLLDYRMPRMDGLGVLREVMADATLSAHHTYLIITANPYSLPPELLELAERFSIPIIPKPFDVDDLCGRVRQAQVALAARQSADEKSGHVLSLSGRCA